MRHLFAVSSPPIAGWTAPEHFFRISSEITWRCLAFLEILALPFLGEAVLRKRPGATEELLRKKLEEKSPVVSRAPASFEAEAEKLGVFVGAARKSLRLRWTGRMIRITTSEASELMASYQQCQSISPRIVSGKTTSRTIISIK
jgi:hypothetical protein